MSETLVNLTIDGIEVSVPKGTLIVDAAKKVGIDIPVFCYHPKLSPAGSCRMCLVEIGRPAWDREKGEPVLDEKGQPVINFGPNLETSCTTPVGEGWVVRVNSEKAREGRKQIVEFLLTSHPLDCPICDKGGECPLQELTLRHGSAESRFLLDEKMHLAKHVPLGDLIYLDRERCIQCGRCVRFQEDIAGEPVIGFTLRGRKLEIFSATTPGFDSIFSGNATDICPVGALTTADFRFGARPWELDAAASICPHCPVGCNLILNTRRDASVGGREVVKRVMPRQNEAVNEIWICDKGRFAHHYAGSDERLTKPLIRMEGDLVETTWEKALIRAAEGLRGASDLVGLTSGRVSNEDLFNFRKLVEAAGGRTILYDGLAGGDMVQRVGLGSESNLGNLGKGDAILVIAVDLYEEAPIWWLRVKQATDRGAILVVANARPTRLDQYAQQVLRYSFTEVEQTALGMLQAVVKSPDLSSYAGDKDLQAAAKSLVEAENLVIFYGGEGLDYTGSAGLAQACASLLSATGHTGKPNNGLIAVWPRTNTQGAWDMGLQPLSDGLGPAVKDTDALYVMAADPVGDEPPLAELFGENVFLIVQDLFLTPTAALADVVFPAQSIIERDGTFTTGERRVQRFYSGVPARGESRPDWQIAASLAKVLDIEMDASSAEDVMREIAGVVPDYAGLTYEKLSEVNKQWPYVGGDDLYFGGTAFANTQGLGVQLPSAAEKGEKIEVAWTPPAKRKREKGLLLLIPITRLYDRGRMLIYSKHLLSLTASDQLAFNPDDADRLGVRDGTHVEIGWDGQTARLHACVEEGVPKGTVLSPLSVGIPIAHPVIVQVEPVKERETA